MTTTTYRGQDGAIYAGGVLVGSPLVNGALSGAATTLSVKVTSGTLKGVVLAGDMFSVGGELPTSGSWVDRTAAMGVGSHDVRAVAWGNGIFVALGAGTYSGMGLWTSGDGLNWLSHVPPFDSVPLCITYGNGVFVAGTTGGFIWTSLDGVTWVQQSNTSGSAINAVAYAGGLWVACGAGGFLISSADTVTWTNRTSGVAVNLAAILYIPAVGWVIGGGAAAGNAVILFSANGTTGWSSETTDVPASNPIHCGTMLGATAIFGADGGNVTVSTNGTSWTHHTVAGSPGAFYSGTTGNALAAFFGSSGKVATSPDGTTWTATATPISPAEFYGAAYAATLCRYVVVGAAGAAMSGEPFHTVTGGPWVPVANAITSMTFSGGIDTGGTADGAVLQFVSNVVGATKGWEFEVSLKMLDSTVQGDAWEEQVPGPAKWVGRATARFDYADPGQKKLTDAIVTATPSATSRGLVFALASGKVWYGYGYVSGHKPSAPVGAVIWADLTFTGTGAAVPDWQ